MTLISHANTIPWLVEPGFFMTLTMLLINALCAITVVTLIYRVLYRLLSHAQTSQASEQNTGGIGGTSLNKPFTGKAQTLNTFHSEASDHET
jgi:hypothetical protein